jgi:hypothetical protein
MSHLPISIRGSLIPVPLVPACGGRPPGQGAIPDHAGLRPAFFVLVWAAWLAAPSQDGPLDHVCRG